MNPDHGMGVQVRPGVSQNAPRVQPGMAARATREGDAIGSREVGREAAPDRSQGTWALPRQGRF